MAVFELALAALAELLADRRDETPGAGLDANHEPVVCEFAVAAPDRAALLAAFLEELVYLLETDDLVPERAERLELAGTRLTATVRGYRGNPRHLVKAVTYHELKFAPADGGFAATVVLDV
jgi:SHS2 domain-containing protein